MEGLRKRLDAGEVAVVYVYTREPHANQRFMGFDFSEDDQTRSVAERVRYARRCREKHKHTIPWIIDDMRGSVQKAYGGLPNSGFVIRSDGVVAFKEPWAKAADLEGAVAALHPPAFYRAGEEERAVLLKVYEAALRLARSRETEGRLAAADALAALAHPAVLPRLAAGLRDAEPAVREKTWTILKALLPDLPATLFDPAAEDAKLRAAAAEILAPKLKAAEKAYTWDPKAKAFVPAKKGGAVSWAPEEERKAGD